MKQTTITQEYIIYIDEKKDNKNIRI